MDILNDNFVLRKRTVRINTCNCGGLLNISVDPTKLYEYLIKKKKKKNNNNNIITIL